MSERGRVAAFYGRERNLRSKTTSFRSQSREQSCSRRRSLTCAALICTSGAVSSTLPQFGRPYPQILGHEMAATVYRLGDGVTRDTAGEDLHVGDRVVFRYFHPCGRCRACLKRVFRACPFARSYLTRSCDESPHFYGAFGEFHYLSPGAAVFRVPDTLSDVMVAGANCALSQVVGGLQLAGLKMGETVVIQGPGAWVSMRPPSHGRWALARSLSWTASRSGSPSRKALAPTTRSISAS